MYAVIVNAGPGQTVSGGRLAFVLDSDLDPVLHHQWSIEGRGISQARGPPRRPRPARAPRPAAHRPRRSRHRAVLREGVGVRPRNRAARQRAGLRPPVGRRRRGLGGAQSLAEPSAEEPQIFGDEVAEPLRRLGRRGAEAVARDRAGRPQRGEDRPQRLDAGVVRAPLPPGRPRHRHDRRRRRRIASVCVEHTVRDASAAGLRVVLVADACAAVQDSPSSRTLSHGRASMPVQADGDVLELIAGAQVVE